MLFLTNKNLNFAMKKEMNLLQKLQT